METVPHDPDDFGVLSEIVPYFADETADGAR